MSHAKYQNDIERKPIIQLVQYPTNIDNIKESYQNKEQIDHSPGKNKDLHISFGLKKAPKLG